MANKKASEAARALAKRSIKARKEKWGEEEFQRRMQEYGKLGGRPPKQKDEKKSGSRKAGK